MQALVAPMVAFTVFLFMVACGPEDLTGVENPSSITLTEPKDNVFSPTADDVKLSIKVYKQECFGSAGCLITFKVKVDVVTPDKWDPNNIYTVTYRITGGKQPLISSAEISEGRYRPDSEETIQVPSESSKLKAKVISFE